MFKSNWWICIEMIMNRIEIQRPPNEAFHLMRILVSWWSRLRLWIYILFMKTKWMVAFMICRILNVQSSPFKVKQWRIASSMAWVHSASTDDDLSSDRQRLSGIYWCLCLSHKCSQSSINQNRRERVALVVAVSDIVFYGIWYINSSVMVLHTTKISIKCQRQCLPIRECSINFQQKCEKKNYNINVGIKRVGRQKSDLNVEWRKSTPLIV